MPEGGEPENPSDAESNAPQVPAERPTSRDVFISYASKDTAVADAACEALERHGVLCWLAPRDVTPGTQYADAIVRAINGAKVVVVVLSESAVGSSHVGKEVERASSKRRAIVALRIDAAPLTPALEYFLSESQWIDTRVGGMDSALAKLVNAVQRLQAPAPAVETVAGGALTSERSNFKSQAEGDRSHADHSAQLTAAKPKASLASRLLVASMALIAAAVVYILADKFWLSKRSSAEQPTALALSAPTSEAHIAAPISDQSIAVLPFTDMSEKKDQEYFSDGLSEELIDLLAKIPELHVPARTSSFYFKGRPATMAEIAKALGVAHVLEGSVRKSGDTLRVTAQLIRTDNGYHLWSETYDRKLDNLFKVQDEIATSVVGALKVKLLQPPSSSDRRSANPDAYNQYLIGRQFFMRNNWDDFSLAVTAFRKSIELDPGYAPAWAALASATYWVADDAKSAAAVTSGQEEARVAADKAIALGPDLADGYVVRAAIRATTQWDFKGADEDFRHALKLAPENSDALFSYAETVLLPTGQVANGVAALNKGISADPLNARLYSLLGNALILNGKYTAAREALNRSLEISPKQTYTAAGIGYTFLLEGNPAAALAIAPRASSEVFRLHVASLAKQDLGDAKESQRLLDELIAKFGFSAAYQIAESYAWRGDKDHAFEWLEKAHAQRDGGLTFIKVDPMLRKLRDDARYFALLRTLNLAQ